MDYVYGEIDLVSTGDLRMTMEKVEFEAKEGNLRLEFEGDLDKWMKIIGAGITGYQPEAYAVMDWACAELVTLRARDEKLQLALRQISNLPVLSMQDAWQNSRDMREMATAALAATMEGSADG